MTDDYVNRTELADWLDLTSRQVSALRSKGIFVSDTEGTEETRYHLKDSIRAYCKYTRERKGFMSEKEKGMRLDNELKEEQLAKARGEVYDRASIDRDFTMYAAEIVKLHKSFVPWLKKRNPKVAQRVWDAIEERLTGIREAAKEIRISDEAKFGDSET